MNKQYEQVAEFHEACSIEMPDKPLMLENDEETRLYFSLEIKALSIGMKNFSKHEGASPVCDRISYMIEELAEFAASQTIEDQADALTDLIYFALGTFTLMGIKPEQIFNEVQAANMRKVVNGKVLRNEQGKIVKPDGWYGPEKKIKSEILVQSGETIRIKIVSCTSDSDGLCAWWYHDKIGEEYEVYQCPKFSHYVITEIEIKGRIQEHHINKLDCIPIEV